jgi:hypothetical protein
LSFLCIAVIARWQCFIVPQYASSYWSIFFVELSSLFAVVAKQMRFSYIWFRDWREWGGSIQDSKPAITCCEPSFSFPRNPTPMWTIHQQEDKYPSVVNASLTKSLHLLNIE